MPFFYYYDPYYWMILVPAMLIALLAQLNVSSTFNRYSRMASRRGFTGAQAAEAVLRAHGIQNVRIERVSGRLTDHYDPRSNVIRLLLYSQPLFGVGVLLFATAVVFQLVTLPVEFNASRRAIASLEGTHLLEDDELRGARKVLGAAAMTYVAALLVSLAQLLRFLLAFAGRRRD